MSHDRLERGGEALRPIKAYLASALTGLTDEARASTFAVSDVVAAACVEEGIELYEPRASTDPVHHPEVADVEVYVTDRARVLGTDLLVLLADEPSTGAGQELAIAKAALLPVLVLAHQNRRVSRMITGALTPGDVVLRYSDTGHLAAVLSGALHALAAGLPRWSAPASSFGRRLADHRKAADLTPEALCAAVGDGQAFTPGYLAALESADDRDTNPSLAEIRALAAALSVPPAVLLGP